MFDIFTTAELYRLHNTLFDDHTRTYQATAALPILHPDYRIARAAMDEISETLSAIYTEITRREQDPVNA